MYKESTESEPLVNLEVDEQSKGGILLRIIVMVKITIIFVHRSELYCFTF